MKTYYRSQGNPIDSFTVNRQLRGLDIFAYEIKSTDATKEVFLQRDENIIKTKSNFYFNGNSEDGLLLVNGKFESNVSSDGDGKFKFENTKDKFSYISKLSVVEDSESPTDNADSTDFRYIYEVSENSSEIENIQNIKIFTKNTSN